MGVVVVAVRVVVVIIMRVVVVVMCVIVVIIMRVVVMCVGCGGSTAGELLRRAMRMIVSFVRMIVWRWVRVTHGGRSY